MLELVEAQLAETNSKQRRWENPLGRELQRQILQGGGLLIRNFFENSNRRCKSQFRLKLIPFG